MLVAHGRGEHGARYERFAESLTPRGYGCAAFDFRGFGRAPGARGHIDRFSDYLDDLDGAVASATALAAGAPLYLLGHSMGGLASLRWSQERNGGGAVHGLILSGPFLALPSPPTGIKLAALRLISATSPGKVIAGAGKPATRDEAWLQLKRDDPLQVAAPTARWITECMKAQARAGDPGIPLLTVQGGADVSTDPAASRELTQRCAHGSYKEYPGLLHEVLNELPDDRARVIDDLLAWLDDQSGAGRQKEKESSSPA